MGRSVIPAGPRSPFPPSSPQVKQSFFRNGHDALECFAAATSSVAQGVTAGDSARAAEANPPGTPPAAPAGFHWQAVPELSDEFDGSELDPGKWLPYQPYWKGRQPSQFEPKNVAVSGGNLLLRSTPKVADLAEVKNPESDVWVNSACVPPRNNRWPRMAITRLASRRRACR